MKFLNFLVEKFNFDFDTTVDAKIELESMRKFKSIFGGDSFKLKGVNYKFSNHAAHRYLERVDNESKLFLLDQFKKISDGIKGKDDGKYYHVKIKKINKGFIIKKNNDYNANVITVYGDDMKNRRKSTETIILESLCELIVIE